MKSLCYHLYSELESGFRREQIYKKNQGTGIEWTHIPGYKGEIWNPTTGCTRASSGCDNCYAVKMTKRLELMGQEAYRGLVNDGKSHFNGVVKCHEDRLAIPSRHTKPRAYFVNSMSDLFHKEVPFEFVDKVFAVMALNPQHIFMILTKRPERMAEYLASGCALWERWAKYMEPNHQQIGMAAYGSRRWSDVASFAWPSRNAREFPLKNVWLGTSVEDQKAADERIPHLLRCPAAVRFLSCEPLIGAVDLYLDDNAYICPNCNGYSTHHEVRPYPDDFCAMRCECGFQTDVGEEFHVGCGIDWVIAGGESGPGRRPMELDWMRSIRDQSKVAGVPFFGKQWDKVQQLPDDLMIREFPAGRIK